MKLKKPINRQLLLYFILLRGSMYKIQNSLLELVHQVNFCRTKKSDLLCYKALIRLLFGRLEKELMFLLTVNLQYCYCDYRQ